MLRRPLPAAYTGTEKSLSLGLITSPLIPGAHDLHRERQILVMLKVLRIPVVSTDLE